MQLHPNTLEPPCLDVSEPSARKRLAFGSSSEDEMSQIVYCNPKGPKYPVLKVSLLGIVVMGWGRYLVFGYLDPEGKLETFSENLLCKPGTRY